MRVATHNSHAGQGSALLWAHYMHDALTLISEVNERDVEVITVRIECLELQPARIVSNTRVSL
jgi:hypothetical protein